MNSERRTYEDPEGLFKIHVPSDWLADTSGQAGTRVAFVSPEVVMGFQANVNVVVNLRGGHPSDSEVQGGGALTVTRFMKET